MEDNQISMCEMARRADLSQPGLRACCWHKAMPTETTLRKIARVLKLPPAQLLKWVYEDKIRYGYQAGVADALLQTVEDTIKVLQITTNNYPEDKRPSDYQIIEQALKQTLNILKIFKVSDVKEEALVD
jgi:hypothetical protein